jgi:hypothetical protein
MALVKAWHRPSGEAWIGAARPALPNRPEARLAASSTQHSIAISVARIGLTDVVDLRARLRYQAGRARARRLRACSGGSAFQARFHGPDGEQIVELRFDPAEAL